MIRNAADATTRVYIVKFSAPRRGVDDVLQHERQLSRLEGESNSPQKNHAYTAPAYSVYMLMPKTVPWHGAITPLAHLTSNVCICQRADRDGVLFQGGQAGKSGFSRSSASNQQA